MTFNLPRRLKGTGLGFILTGLLVAGLRLPDKARGSDADDPSHQQEVKASQVHLPQGERTLSDWLQALEKSGNRVEHQRSLPILVKPILSDQGSAETLDYWPAVDRMAKYFALRIERRSQPSRLLLRDRSAASPEVQPVAYSGPFRIALERIGVQRDWHEPRHSHLTLHLSLLWEPRYQPFWMQMAPDGVRWRAEAAGASVTVQSTSQAILPLAGQAQGAWSIQLPAPSRTLTHLAMVEGKVQVYLSPRWLDLELDPTLTPQSQTVERVTVQLLSMQHDAVRRTWKASWKLHYPAGYLDLESHQAWALSDVEATLASTAPGGRLHRGRVKVVSIDEGQGVRFEHEFSETPEALDQMRLRVQVPGLPEAYPVAWQFKELPLP